MADRDDKVHPQTNPHSAGFLHRADELDASVQDLLAELDLTRTDDAHQRMLDAIMGISRAADALRAFARNDLVAMTEATSSMGFYARRAMGEQAA